MRRHTVNLKVKTPNRKTKTFRIEKRLKDLKVDEKSGSVSAAGGLAVKRSFA